MKRKCFILVLLLLTMTSHAQLPCDHFMFDGNSSSGRVIFLSNYNIPNNTSVLFNNITFYGLAVGPAFNFFAPDPTYWITVGNYTTGTTYAYYNGSTFVSTGHTNGISPNFGGTKNYIYSMASGGIQRYNGTGNATFMTSLSYNTDVADIVGDDLDGFFLIHMQNPQSLAHFDSTGALTHTYAITGAPNGMNGGGGFAISGNSIAISNTLQDYIGIISGAVVHLTPTVIHAGIFDFASCPVQMATFPVGIKTNSKAMVFTLYPNPARDFIRVSLSDDFHSVKCMIYSSNGTLVYDAFVELFDRKAEIAIEALPRGVYSLHLKTKHEDVNTRFIKISESD